MRNRQPHMSDVIGYKFFISLCEEGAGWHAEREDGRLFVSWSPYPGWYYCDHQMDVKEMKWLVVEKDCPHCIWSEPHKHLLRPDGEIGAIVAPLKPGDRDDD